MGIMGWPRFGPMPNTHLLERLVEQRGVGEAGGHVGHVLVVQLNDRPHKLLLCGRPAVLGRPALGCRGQRQGEHGCFMNNCCIKRVLKMRLAMRSLRNPKAPSGAPMRTLEDLLRNLPASLSFFASTSSVTSFTSLFPSPSTCAWWCSTRGHMGSTTSQYSA